MIQNFTRELTRYMDKRETVQAVTGIAGVSSIKASSAAQLTGDVTLSADTGVSLTQSGQTITISVSNDISIDEQTGATYTLGSSDDGKLIEMNSTSAQTLSVPSSSSVSFDTGTQILFRQKGAGQVTVSPTTGVTLQAADSGLKTRVQYSIGGLIKVTTNTWSVFGDLTT